VDQLDLFLAVLEQRFVADLCVWCVRIQSCLPVVHVPQRASYPSSTMYDPIDLPSSKLQSSPVADQVYRQMRTSLVPVIMNPLARLASQLIRYLLLVLFRISVCIMFSVLFVFFPL